MGSKVVESRGSPLGIRNVQIPRVTPCVQKWSNPKAPPLGSEMFKSQGSHLGFKSDRIARVPPWDQKCSNPKDPTLGSKMVKSKGPLRRAEMIKSQRTPYEL